MSSNPSQAIFCVNFGGLRYRLFYPVPKTRDLGTAFGVPDQELVPNGIFNWCLKPFFAIFLVVKFSHGGSDLFQLFFRSTEARQDFLMLASAFVFTSLLVARMATSAHEKQHSCFILDPAFSYFSFRSTSVSA